MEKLNEIVTLAHSIPKPSKADMYETLIDIITSDEPPTVDQLASLYCAYVPPVPATPKTALQWLRKAMANSKEVRYYLRYIYKDGDMVVATDGHRLHMVESDNIPELDGNGFHDAMGVPVDVDSKYPDWQRIIPKPDKTEIIQLNDCEVRKAGKWHGINIIDDCWVNVDYLKQSIGKDKTVLILNSESCKGGTSAVLIQCEHGQAVIMPIRMDRE
jgi:hypothetical protein